MRLLLVLVGNRGLPSDSPARGVAQQFLTYFVRKFVATVEQMPSLHIQVNEIMTPADAFYYDHSGTDKTRFRAPKYEFALTTKAKQDFNEERQVALLVAALIDVGKDAWLQWAEQSLNNAINESKESGGLRRLILATDLEKLKTISSDALLRLFLRSLGLVVNIEQGQIVVPGDIDEGALIDKLLWVAKYQKETVEFPNKKTAMDFIKIEGEPDRIEYESDEDGNEGDASMLAPVPGPKLNRKPAYAKPFRPRLLPDVRQSSPSDPSSSSPTTPALSPQEDSGPAFPAKRLRSDAFALDPSDDEDNGVSQSIAAIRRRKAIDDDDSD